MLLDILNAAGVEETYDATLWDAAASAFTSGTYNWTAYAGTTMSNDGADGNALPSLSLAYDTSANGAYNFLRNASDLSADLVVGTLYKITYDLIKSGGNSPTDIYTDKWRGRREQTNHILVLLHGQHRQCILSYWTATHATTDYFRFLLGAAGQTIHVDNTNI